MLARSRSLQKDVVVLFHPKGQVESTQNVEVLGDSLSPFCLFILLLNYISEVYCVHYTPLHVSTKCIC